MLVRERREGDAPRLLEIARLVHARDKYPFYLPDSDYARFLFGHETLGAWVAEGDDVVGQIALHPHSSAPVIELAADVLAEPAARLGVVARLLVHPARRRLGIGAQLLDRAAREAAELGLSAVLDVVTELADAISLYEHQGWVRLGEVTVTFRGDVTVRELVFAAPPHLRPA